jgi:hypothetical protein
MLARPLVEKEAGEEIKEIALAEAASGTGSPNR